MGKERQSEQAEELFLSSAVFVETAFIMKVPDTGALTQYMCSGGPQGLAKGAWASTLLQEM